MIFRGSEFHALSFFLRKIFNAYNANVCDLYFTGGKLMENKNQAREVILMILIGVIMTGWLGPIGLIGTCCAVAYKYKKRGA